MPLHAERAAIAGRRHPRAEASDARTERQCSELADQFASLAADQTLDEWNASCDRTHHPTQDKGADEYDRGFDDGE